MDTTWLDTFLQHYNWLGSLVALVGVVVLTKLSRYLVFRLKPLQEMRKINREQDKIKWKQDKYPPIVKANQKVGLWTNIVFFALMLPFFVCRRGKSCWIFLSS
jgi:hypothetical protein